MNEEVLNMSIRKFLKKVGINAQREIEKLIHQAEADGKLGSDAPVKVQMTLDCELLDAPLVISEEISYR
jgi:hypothetical protein